MRYKVNKTSVVNPDINSSEWDKAEVGHLTKQRWKEFFQPINTSFKILRGPRGISVLMHTDEKNLRAVNKEENSRVCDDSCMEFFFKPDPWDTKYINFEFNPDGILFLSVGTDRYDREILDTDREIFKIESIPNDGDWSLKFYIPDDFLFNYFNKISDVCRGNFYKCGELTGHSHFISWVEAEAPEPDFHIPDFFGYLEF
ncbi:MAG: hypothetical protein E7411_00570 [Ruminococcaceae bacterium]|nr:hypothetical protein [Oscillospiraceae bacterium]